MGRAIEGAKAAAPGAQQTFSRRQQPNLAAADAATANAISRYPRPITTEDGSWEKAQDEARPNNRHVPTPGENRECSLDSGASEEKSERDSGYRAG